MTSMSDQSYTCFVCNKKFAKKFNLCRHFLKFHPDSYFDEDRKFPEFQCYICNTAFVHRKSLLRHMRNFHDEISSASVNSYEEEYAESASSDNVAYEQSSDDASSEAPYVVSLGNVAVKTHSSTSKTTAVPCVVSLRNSSVLSAKSSATSAASNKLEIFSSAKNAASSDASVRNGAATSSFSSAFPNPTVECMGTIGSEVIAASSEKAARTTATPNNEVPVVEQLDQLSSADSVSTTAVKIINIKSNIGSAATNCNTSAVPNHLAQDVNAASTMNCTSNDDLINDNIKVDKDESVIFETEVLPGSAVRIVSDSSISRIETKTVSGKTFLVVYGATQSYPSAKGSQNESNSTSVSENREDVVLSDAMPTEVERTSEKTSKSGKKVSNQIDGEGLKKFTCSECDESFGKKYNFKRHMSDLHPEKCEKVQANKLFSCTFCSASFSARKSVKRHMRSFHEDILQTCSEEEIIANCQINKEISCKEKPPRRRPNLCPLCDSSFSTVKETVSHIRSSHKDVELKFENIIFKRAEHFEEWKSRLEHDTKSRFVKHNGKCVRVSGIESTRYYCNRSGMKRIKKNKSQRVKFGGSNKIGRVCPAGINLKKIIGQDGKPKIIATFQSVHVGHSTSVTNNTSNEALENSNGIGELTIATSVESCTTKEKDKLVRCSLCENVFCQKKNMRRHIRKFHPNMLQASPRKKNNKVSVIANDEAAEALAYLNYSADPAITYKVIPSTTYDVVPAAAYDVIPTATYDVIPSAMYNAVPGVTYDIVPVIVPDAIPNTYEVNTEPLSYDTYAENNDVDVNADHVAVDTDHVAVDNDNEAVATDQMSDSTVTVTSTREALAVVKDTQNNTEPRCVIRTHKGPALNKLCPLCDSYFTVFREVLSHLKSDHNNIELSFESKEFLYMEDFEDWKENFEDITQSRFVKQRGKRLCAGGIESSTYFCHRSGNSALKKNRHRRMKCTGSNKTGRICPAFIKVQTSVDDIESKIMVTVQSVHLGHDKEVERLPLRRTERCELAMQLSLNISKDAILHHINSSCPPSKRMRYTRKKDLYNICRDYRIQNPRQPSSKRKKKLSNEM